MRSGVSASLKACARFRASLANGQAGRFMRSRIFRSIWRMAEAAQRSRNRIQKLQKCYSTGRTLQLFRERPLQRPVICACRTRLPSSASRKGCGDSKDFLHVRKPRHSSPVKPEPFRIEPKFVERIWGMRSLAPLFPKKTNLQEPIGEVWLTAVDCKIATGPFAGKTLGEAWTEMPPEWRGTHIIEPGDFPLLIKFIFPNDKLSIQVHPDDAYAALHEQAAGGRGKTEMWHVVSAEPNSRVLVGLRPDVDKSTFLRALASHQLEDLFESHVVHAGDTLFVPAGTPHTIG